MQITRKHVEKISIRCEKNHWWANFFLDCELGEISIRSDWGNWAYRWSSFTGDELKKFLAEKDGDLYYLMSKLAGKNDRDIFMFDETIVKVKKELFRIRREREIDSEITRLFYDELTDIENTSSSDYFLNKVFDIEGFGKVFEDSYEFMDLLVFGFSLSLRGFLKTAWPVFAEELRKELKEKTILSEV